jgi:hypothetical protein
VIGEKTPRMNKANAVFLVVAVVVVVVVIA